MFTRKDIEIDGHELVVSFEDPQHGLSAIVSVHDTSIGPGLGGCRMEAYPDQESALKDLLRLSEAMTYKNALCGINFGGGKSVIIADRSLKKGRSELFRSFGRCIDALGGKYITAEDMGTSVQDMSYILESCPYVSGRDPERGFGGDPSPYTALGVFEGMKACLEHVYSDASFSSRRVAIQGLGNVGIYLARLLKKAGAELIISDIDPTRTALGQNEFAAEIVDANSITSCECDIFAPCALGATINPQSIPQLNCRIVAGGANNQLECPDCEQLLEKRGIVYAPDFAINAGGVILCASEFEKGGFSEAWVREKTLAIYGTIKEILTKSQQTNKSCGAVALELAKERIENARSGQA